MPHVILIGLSRKSNSANASNSAKVLADEAERGMRGQEEGEQINNAINEKRLNEMHALRQTRVAKALVRTRPMSAPGCDAADAKRGVFVSFIDVRLLLLLLSFLLLSRLHGRPHHRARPPIPKLKRACMLIPAAPSTGGQWAWEFDKKQRREPGTGNHKGTHTPNSTRDHRGNKSSAPHRSQAGPWQTADGAAAAPQLACPIRLGMLARLPTQERGPPSSHRQGTHTHKRTTPAFTPAASCASRAACSCNSPLQRLLTSGQMLPTQGAAHVTCISVCILPRFGRIRPNSEEHVPNLATIGRKRVDIAEMWHTASRTSCKILPIPTPYFDQPWSFLNRRWPDARHTWCGIDQLCGDVSRARPCGGQF